MPFAFSRGFFSSLTSRILRAERQHENSTHKNISRPARRRAGEFPGPRIPPFRLRFYDPASNPETLARRSFPVAPFYWFATRTRRILADMPAEDQHRRFQRQLGANRDFGPLDARVFRGVFPPSLCPPRRHPRDPLISGLRGSRNEPSEARWHEEGSVGWAVGGSCSKLRYRDLATLTPLLVNPPLPPCAATKQQPPSSWKTPMSQAFHI